MCSIEKLNDKSTKKAFDKRVISATQHMHAYVKNRLYIAESTGVIPKNMFSSNGIIDEGIAQLYEHGFDVDSTTEVIKLRLFKTVSSYLDSIFRNESFHKNTVSTNDILQEELDELEETFTMNADWDIVFNKDLNDISYKQDQKHKHLFLFADHNNSVLNALDIENVAPKKSRKLLGSLYSWLPLNVSNIIDLMVFGQLSFEEISFVQSIEVKRVEYIYEEVKKQFKDHLD